MATQSRGHGTRDSFDHFRLVEHDFGPLPGPSMHVLFLHQNFPAQFGMIAGQMARDGHRVTFVSRKEAGTVDGIVRIPYEPRGGATAQTHYGSRTFENMVWHS